VACERAKRTLSSASVANIEIDALYEGHDYMTTISRAKFEDLANPLFQKTMEPGYKVLKDAKIGKDRIDDIVLVGGSTRIPKIQQMLKDFFNKEPCSGINPDEAVAYGATVQAAILAGIESEVTSDILLLDVTPLSIGIETAGNIMTVLIERNSTIPVQKTKTFSTYSDNQPSATIKVLEGERARSADNNTLGVFQLDGIPPAPRGQPQIEVTYDIDANGIITVKALVKGADGVAKEMTIKRESSHLSKEAIEKMCREAESYKEEDELLRKTMEKRNMYESTLYSSKIFAEKDEAIKKFIEDEISWLNYSQEATLEEYEKRLQILQEKVKDILPKPAGEPEPTKPESTPSEPHIEEVD
jgi:L1 cell adhesion molecule like protein